MTDSAAWEKFLKSNFFGSPYYAWHDGEDIHVLKEFTDEERAKAEAIFLEKLPDTRMIVGLEELRSTKALDQLRKLLRHKTAAVRIRSAHAIRVISGDAVGLHVLTEAVVDQKLSFTDRYDAAIQLRAFHMQESANALIKALDDPDSTVRFHAGVTLCQMYRVSVDTGAIHRGDPDVVAELKKLVAAGTIKAL